MNKTLAASCLTIASVFLFCQTAMAEDVKHDLKAGDLSLLFNMSSLFNDSPSNYNDVGIGGRYVLNERLTLRGGLGFNQLTSESAQGTESVEDTSQLLALEAGIEYLLFRSGPVGCYTGAMLQFATGSSEPNSGTETSSQAVTLAGLLGVNYFLLDNLSLGAEYRLGFSQLSTEQKFENDTTQENTDTRIGTGSVGFIVGFWFN